MCWSQRRVASFSGESWEEEEEEERSCCCCWITLKGKRAIFFCGFLVGGKRMANPEQPAKGWGDSYGGMSSDNIKGLILGMSSSIFIGSSFIIKKMGLKKAGSTGLRAG